MDMKYSMHQSTEIFLNGRAQQVETNHSEPNGKGGVENKMHLRDKKTGELNILSVVTTTSMLYGGA